MDKFLATSDLNQTADETSELSEAQLELVAGGSGDVVFATKPGS